MTRTAIKITTPSASLGSLVSITRITSQHHHHHHHRHHHHHHHHHHHRHHHHQGRCSTTQQHLQQPHLQHVPHCNKQLRV
ncbi:hypothetical protein FHG87_023116 [Trinorchestia longiramus]|nr:hypothetical protein FHG87_023116 [Trinorchestia longiramus]